MKRSLEVAALAMAMAFGPFEAWAGSSPVDCGMVVTQDIVLERDLVCTGPGLIVGADGVSIDLDGHTLYGQGTGIGVGNLGGFDHIVIKNGVIDGFTSGVVLQATSGNPASYNSLSRLVVQHNKLPGYGIVVQYADHLTISRSAIHHNQQAGILLSNTIDSLLSGNVIYDNENHGLWLSAYSNKNVIENNRVFGHVADNFVAGIIVSDSSNNNLRSNDLSDNFIGAWVESGANNFVEKNESSYNKAAGIYVRFATQTSITLNTTIRNGFAPGIFFPGPGVNDGINSGGATVTLTKNKASFNADYGIEAIQAVDGGGNKAQGNGNASQCTGVECR